MENMTLYLGSYREQFWLTTSMDPDLNGHGQGVYAYRLRDGLLERAQALTGPISPAALCVSPDAKHMFAASDTNDFINYEHSSGGGVYSLLLDAQGALRGADSRSSCGSRATDVCCDRTGRYVAAVNCGTYYRTTEYRKNAKGEYEPKLCFDEGCVTLLKISEDGRFERVCDRYALPDGIPAHPYTAVFDERDLIYVANRSAGICVLRFDRENEKLVPASMCPLPGEPSCLARNPGSDVLFCGNRETGCVDALRIDARAGTVRPVSRTALYQNISDGALRRVGAIALAPDGKRLYAAARDHAELTVFSVGDDLSLRVEECLTEGFEMKDGFGVRRLAVSPDGKYLAACCPTLDRVLLYAIDDCGTRLVQSADAVSPAGALFVAL